MVFVACKIPNGLVIASKGKKHVLLGPNKVAINERPGGFAITPGVDDQLWADWLAANAASEVVQNSLVFADADFNTCQARAWSKARTVSGFAPAFR